MRRRLRSKPRCNFAALVATAKHSTIADRATSSRMTPSLKTAVRPRVRTQTLEGLESLKHQDAIG